MKLSSIFTVLVSLGLGFALGALTDHWLFHRTWMEVGKTLFDECGALGIAALTFWIINKLKKYGIRP